MKSPYNNALWLATQYTRPEQLNFKSGTAFTLPNSTYISILELVTSRHSHQSIMSKLELKGRKFVLFIALSCLSSLFLTMNLLNGDQWVSFNQWIFGIYATGNIGSKATSVFESQITKNK